MSNLSDKDIDGLSRKASDLYEPDASNLSWSRLERRLTEQMPGRPPDGFRFGRISPYVWAPAVVLIAGLSFYLIKNTDYSKHFTRTDQGHTIAEAPTTAAPDKKQADKNPNTISIVPSAKTGSPISETVASTATGITPGNGMQPDAQGRNRQKKREARYAAGIGAASASIVANGALANKSADGSGPSLISNDSRESNQSALAPAANNNKVSNHESAAHNLPLVVTTGTRTGKITGNDSLLNSMNELKTSVPQKSLRINRSLNFGLTFGPDYTNGGGIANNQFSNNIGITVGYYLTNKISVNTGILYSNKFFWAPGKQFGGISRSGLAQGVYGSYAAAPDIKYINGSANLYELPFTLRYDFAQDERTKFFANAGLSSYFIIKQTSIYFSDRTPLALERTDDSQMNYWFNVANLSFGFESDMGKGFSFQVEPFLKLPLKNMGIENVRLNSYGIMFSFRYAPILSKTKK